MLATSTIEKNGTVFTEPLQLEPGSVVISAFVSREGWGNSPIVSQQYDVIECEEDKCCQWSVVYLHVKRLLGSLLSKNNTLFQGKEMSRTLVDGLQHEWLTSNSRCQAAMIQVKDEDNDAEYALGNQEKWNEAVRASKAQLLSVEKAVGQNIHDL